jgi:aryl-alcohol dehydrogenase-like predicted oxidoreductase
MEYRQLGRSGLKVPVLSLGTGTFGGSNAFFKRWGSVQVDEASRMVDLCLDHELNFFDTADIYSEGASATARGRTTSAPRASTWCALARPASSGSAPIISTSTSCTASTP